MGFTQAVKSVFSKYATFSGRASRSEYWYFVLFNVIVGVVFCIIGGVTMSDVSAIADNASDSSNPVSMMSAVVSTMPGWLAVLMGLYQLLIILPSLAVSVRRMHDIGKGGGWIFISLVPFIGGIWFFVLTLIGSQYGPNRFGPMPE
ncbi:MAG: DUF805 domain-containing protein [Muribaculaceae bacterium]|nr:DUF805 domain-containing protein [Muribaculaceae bacterium]